MLRGTIAKTIRKVVNADFPGRLKYLTGYLAILVGAGLTIVVQSSSIFTSAITPLVGVGVITVERMYPLTLGANIGTTATGILAALVNTGEKLEKGLQLALCHLFFNIIGILIWYPLPFMRIPIPLAKALGDTTSKYRWFALLYIFLIFLVLPAAVFALSIPGWYVLLGVGGPILLLVIIIIIINVIQRKKPSILPAKLRTWDCLPLWMHSLKPLDDIIVRFFICKCCKSLKSSREEDEDHDITNAEQGASKKVALNSVEPSKNEPDETTPNGVINPGFVEENRYYRTTKI